MIAMPPSPSAEIGNLGVIYNTRDYRYPYVDRTTITLLCTLAMLIFFSTLMWTRHTSRRRYDNPVFDRCWLLLHVYEHDKSNSIIPTSDGHLCPPPIILFYDN